MKISKNKGIMLAVLVGSSALSPASLLYAASAPQSAQVSQDYCNKTGLALALTAGAGVTVYGALKLREEYARHNYAQTVRNLKHLLAAAKLLEKKLARVSGLTKQEDKKLLELFNAKKNNNTDIAKKAYIDYVNELVSRYTKLASGAQLLASGAKSENDSAKAGWASILKIYAAQPFKDLASNDYGQVAKGAVKLIAGGFVLGGSIYFDVLGKTLGAFGLVKNETTTFPQVPEIKKAAKVEKNAPNGGGSSSSSSAKVGTGLGEKEQEEIAKAISAADSAKREQEKEDRAIALSLENDGRQSGQDGTNDHGAVSGSGSDSDDDQGPDGQAGAVRRRNSLPLDDQDRANVQPNLNGRAEVGDENVAPGIAVRMYDGASLVLQGIGHMVSRLYGVDITSTDGFLGRPLDGGPRGPGGNGGGAAPVDFVAPRNPGGNNNGGAAVLPEGVPVGPDDDGAGVGGGIVGQAGPAQNGASDNQGSAIQDGFESARSDVDSDDEFASAEEDNGREQRGNSLFASENLIGGDQITLWSLLSNLFSWNSAPSIGNAVRQPNGGPRGPGGNGVAGPAPEQGGEPRVARVINPDTADATNFWAENNGRDNQVDDSAIAGPANAPVGVRPEETVDRATTRDRWAGRGLKRKRTDSTSSDSISIASSNMTDDDISSTSSDNGGGSSSLATRAFGGISYAAKAIYDAFGELYDAYPPEDAQIVEPENRGHILVPLNNVDNAPIVEFLPSDSGDDASSTYSDDSNGGPAPVQNAIVPVAVPRLISGTHNIIAPRQQPLALPAPSSDVVEPDNNRSGAGSGDEGFNSAQESSDVDGAPKAQGWWNAVRNLLRFGAVPAADNAEGDDTRPVLDTTKIAKKPKAQAFANGAVPGAVRRVPPKRDDKGKAAVVPVNADNASAASTRVPADTRTNSALDNLNSGLSAKDFAEQASGRGADLGSGQYKDSYGDASQKFGVATQDGVNRAHRAAEAGRQAAQEQQNRFEAQQAVNRQKSAELQAAQEANLARLLGAGKKAETEGVSSVRPSREQFNPPLDRKIEIQKAKKDLEDAKAEKAKKKSDFRKARKILKDQEKKAQFELAKRKNERGQEREKFDKLAAEHERLRQDLTHEKRARLEEIRKDVESFRTFSLERSNQAGETLDKLAKANNAHDAAKKALDEASEAVYSAKDTVEYYGGSVSSNSAEYSSDSDSSHISVPDTIDTRAADVSGSGKGKESAYVVPTLEDVRVKEKELVNVQVRLDAASVVLDNAKSNVKRADNSTEIAAAEEEQSKIWREYLAASEAAEAAREAHEEGQPGPAGR